MSLVTTILVIVGPQRDEPNVSTIQRWLLDHGHSQMTKIPGRAEGAPVPGDRYLGLGVWYGGLNYLDFRAFMDALAGCGWKVPELISVIADHGDTLQPGLYRLGTDLKWVEVAAPRWYGDDNTLVDAPQLG
jgi:hypothetical protein